MTFNGLILIDKPSGISSHDVVSKVRKIAKTSSVGHCGTLDPLATGLMVVLLNEATKLSQFITEKDKAYDVECEFGKTTDTYDITGTVTNDSLKIPNEAEVSEAVSSLRGAQTLEVPSFSAIKVQGEKLYDKARRGEVFELPTREMSFHSVKINQFSDKRLSASIRCSKGTYIRSWVHELGQRVGSGATMTGLRRTLSEPYSLRDAVTLDQLPQYFEEGNWREPCFIPMEAALPETKIIRIHGHDQTLMGNGMISHDLRAQLIRVFNPDSDRVVRIMTRDTQKLISLVGLEPEKGFMIRRVLKY